MCFNRIPPFFVLLFSITCTILFFSLLKKYPNYRSTNSFDYWFILIMGPITLSIIIIIIAYLCIKDCISYFRPIKKSSLNQALIIDSDSLIV